MRKTIFSRGMQALCIGAAMVLLAGCSTRQVRSNFPTGPVDAQGTVYRDFETAQGATLPSYIRSTTEIGQDADWILEASYLELGQNGEMPAPIQYTDKKGRLQFYQPPPKIKAAQNVYFASRPLQSRSFGKVIGALNNWIAGWTAVKGLEAATAQRASDNALKARQAGETTKQVGLQTAPTVYDPATQAISRAGGAPVIP